jgi:membrane protease YdiL (CAAX protease family)
LSADLKLVVIGLLLILSTLYLADALKLDRHDLGLALWRRDRSGATGAARALHSLGAVVGGLLLQLLIGGVGLLVGVAALRLLPARPDAFGLAGAVPALALTALLLTGLSQELFFRGLLQRLAARAFRVPLGIGLSALLFVLLYAGGPLAGSLLFALALALASGVIAHLSGSVVGLGLMNALALAVYLGLFGDPSVCLQGGIDLGCLLPADLFGDPGGLP